MRVTLIAAALLASPTLAGHDDDARAALALAVARRPAQAPAPPQAPAWPHAGCDCSPACTCGCQDGLPCRCARGLPAAASPVHHYQPTSAPAYRPLAVPPAGTLYRRRGGACGG